MNIKFQSPTKLLFGEHVIKNNADLMLELGKKCMIVTGASSAVKSGALADLTASLDSLSIDYIIHDSVAQNPLLTDAYEAAKKAVDFNADFIVGVGGGSPLDAAKAIKIFAANPTLEMMDIFAYSWKNKSLPMVAIGLTAGTGSEVGKFSVLTKPDGTKQSIAHTECYPAITYSDPRYTFTLPYNFTVSTALDALAHAVEGYYSTNANKISDIFAFEAIETLVVQLKKLSDSKEISGEDRTQLLYASIAAGYTLDTCGTTYCHVLGYFLSEQHGIPHGIACAVYLPDYLQRAKKLMPQRAARFEAKIGTTHESLATLIKNLLPQLSVTLTESEIKTLVDSKTQSSNFKTTAPSGLSADEAYELVSKILGK